MSAMSMRVEAEPRTIQELATQIVRIVWHHERNCGHCAPLACVECAECRAAMEGLIVNAMRAVNGGGVMAEIDTSNYQLVASKGDDVVVMRPKQIMTKDEALVHAAYLVSIVGDDDRWEEVLEAVQST